MGAPFEAIYRRDRFVFHNGMNQASEARQLTRTVKRNPEVQSIAAGAEWLSTRACRKCAKWGQVYCLPQRDTAVTRIRDQDTLAVEGGGRREIQPIAG
jgi:hypothetical protein